MPTEAEFEASPEAVAGRAQLIAGLHHLDPGQMVAFWEAVRRCYGGDGQKNEDPEADTTRASAGFAPRSQTR